MDDVEMVAQVRSFNRTVTQRIGALQDGYLARSRPLGASRLLWEVGEAGADTRSLRTRLGLDSGYLSRLLTLLEREGLVRLAPDGRDRRRRRVALTAAGRRERQLLDEASDTLARDLLAPLRTRQRERLVAAMADVERLLVAGLVRITVEHPASPAAAWCLRSYAEELHRRFPAGFDPARSNSADPDELTEPRGLLLLAWIADEPVGCCALKLHGDEPAEVKRMWVAQTARGLGVGRRLLAEVERRAADLGVTTLHLETNETLTEAIDLYRSSGYVEVAPFNDEPYAHHWFEKRLG